MELVDVGLSGAISSDTLAQQRKDIYEDDLVRVLHCRTYVMNELYNQVREWTWSQTTVQNPKGQKSNGVRLKRLGQMQKTTQEELGQSKETPKK